MKGSQVKKSPARIQPELNAPDLLEPYEYRTRYSPIHDSEFAAQLPCQNKEEFDTPLGTQDESIPLLLYPITSHSNQYERRGAQIEYDDIDTDDTPVPTIVDCSDIRTAIDGTIWNIQEDPISFDSGPTSAAQYLHGEQGSALAFTNDGEHHDKYVSRRRTNHSEATAMGTLELEDEEATQKKLSLMDTQAALTATASAADLESKSNLKEESTDYNDDG